MTITACRWCGRDLVDGEHREGDVTLLTSVIPWSRPDAEDAGLVVQPGQHTVLVEQSAFWVVECIEQPAWTFR
jgi:hypothetical protein